MGKFESAYSFYNDIEFDNSGKKPKLDNLEILRKWSSHYMNSHPPYTCCPPQDPDSQSYDIDLNQYLDYIFFTPKIMRVTKLLDLP